MREYTDTSGSIPKWMTDLALDIYKIIQERGAVDRFREMVDKWASKHERDINNRFEWEERRRQYFQQLSSGDPRLLDEGAGPPEQGWLWEIYILHTVADSASRSEISSPIVKGWVPPKLSAGAEPEICHPLPLSADHELTLEEKYVILAVVYDVGRKGTEEISRSEWPQDWGEEGAVSNAKRSLFFAGLRRDVSELSADDEGWLRILLDYVKRDIEGQTGPTVAGASKDMAPDETRVERCIHKVKNHPVMSFFIVAGAAIIALGAVAGGLDTIINFWGRHISGHDVSQQTRRQDIFEKPIVSATAGVEISVRSDEQIDIYHMTVGIFLVFAKGRDVLLLMKSPDSHARQTGGDIVRYWGDVEMDLTDGAFERPLSILKDTQYIQLQVEAIPRNSEVLSGTINCAFNDGIPVSVSVPPQKMQENKIFVRNIDFRYLATSSSIQGQNE